MRNLFLLPLLLILMTSQSHAQDITGISRDGLYNDIFSYRDSIITHHIDPFTKVTKHDFNKIIDDVAAYAGAMNADELFVRFLKINALIADEHTNVTYRESNVFPLGCFWFDEGIIITKTDMEHQDLLFSRIIAIDGHPIKQVMDSLATLSPNPNPGFLHINSTGFIGSPVILNGLHLINTKDSIRVSLVKTNNDTATVVFHPKNIRHINFTKYRPHDIALRYSHHPPFWYMIDTVHKLVYFQYMRSSDNPQFPMAKLCDTLFRNAAAAGIKKIVIDFRDNSGGDSRVLTPFIEQLRKSTFNTSGGIYVLTGRNTFASSLTNVLEMKKSMPVITIGESTGGSVNYFGEANSFSLPYTRLTITYSTKHFTSDPTKNGPLLPDVTINEKLSDFLNGTDSVLDYIIAH
jgi:hypothetical protein